jgi:hypothetical protein
MMIIIVMLTDLRILQLPLLLDYSLTKIESALRKPQFC